MKAALVVFFIAGILSCVRLYTKIVPLSPENQVEEQSDQEEQIEYEQNEDDAPEEYFC